MGSTRRCRGAAIVAALLTVAIAAALSAAIASRVAHWLDTLRQERDGAQAMEIVRAALDWTCGVLEQDAREGITDHLGEAWAQQTPAIPVERDGEMQGQIQDAAARFNLNNLVRDDGSVDMLWLAAYRRLLQTLGLPAELAGALADWLDRDSEALAGGVEKWGETAHAANRPLRLVGEIGAIPGYTPAAVARLLPFVSALPGRTPVNAGTAGAEVLTALAQQDGAGVAALLAERQRLPYRDKADLLARMEKAGLKVDGSLVDVASHWFFVSGRVRYRDTHRRMEALLHRDGKHTRLVWWSGRQITPHDI